MVNGLVVEVEAPGVAAVGLRGVAVQEGQAEPDRVGRTGQAGQVRLGEHGDLARHHAQPAERRGAGVRLQVQRFEEAAALSVHAVL